MMATSIVPLLYVKMYLKKYERKIMKSLEFLIAFYIFAQKKVLFL